MNKPEDAEDELGIESYENQMRGLMGSTDAAEEQESKYANLQAESQHLKDELESLQERKQNMQLINDQVGGWTRRVTAKMQE